jgi:hypothetical protein
MQTPEGEPFMVDEEAVALMPRAEREVDFYGDAIPVAIVGDEAFVPLRQITDFLGLNWSGQYLRVQRHEILARHVRKVAMTAADGKRYESLCLALEYLPGWLFGVTTSRVREDLRDKLLRYQEECFRILWRAFQSEVQVTAPTNAPLEHVRGLALAIATLAEQQIALEGRVSEADEKASTALVRIDRAAQIVGALERRLSTVEQRTIPPAAISNEQAAEISSQVKALAQLLSEKDTSKNHYQGIFAELYRRFGVSSYKLIRQEQYASVLAFLEEWRLSGAD